MLAPRMACPLLVAVTLTVNTGSRSSRAAPQPHAVTAIAITAARQAHRMAFFPSPLLSKSFTKKALGAASSKIR